MEIVIIVLLCILLVMTVFTLMATKNKSNNQDLLNLQNSIDNIEKNISKLDFIFRDEFYRNREENNKGNRDFREEISTSLMNLTKLNDDRLANIQKDLNVNAKFNRDELSKSLKTFEDRLNQDLKTLNDNQKEKIDDLIKKQDGFVTSTDAKLESVRSTMESSIKSLQEDNSLKLEKMRETVDEKLQSTLEKRLGESFKQVSDRLEAVHKGLGEMQTLAIGVGDLKKVLSNIKNRGVFGEYQLENILEQLLTPEQYGKNVKTKTNSNAMVEFAVKLPGRDDKDKHVWLPIDAKFPTEQYIALMSAYDQGNLHLIEEAKKHLSANIKLAAKDIREKYIDPPNTTDFGIMFLPFEGLYAEVLRNNGLFEMIQRDYKVTITGPTTISAFLNSLQMGFRTLVIEKRSSEVWELLSAVKTEFSKFGEVLDKTKKKLDEASNSIDTASRKSRTIERKLKDVHELPSIDAINMLNEPLDEVENEIDIEEDLFSKSNTGNDNY